MLQWNYLKEQSKKKIINNSYYKEVEKDNDLYDDWVIIFFKYI